MSQQNKSDSSKPLGSNDQPATTAATSGLEQRTKAPMPLANDGGEVNMNEVFGELGLKSKAAASKITSSSKLPRSSQLPSQVNSVNPIASIPSMSSLIGSSKSKLVTASKLRDPSQSKLATASKLMDPSQSKLTTASKHMDPYQWKLTTASKLMDPSQSKLTTASKLMDYTKAPEKLNRKEMKPRQSVLISDYDIAMAARQSKIMKLPAEEQKKQEAWAQSKIAFSGACFQGYNWKRCEGGYICEGNRHYISDELLAQGENGWYALPNAPGTKRPVFDLNGLIGPWYGNPESEDGAIGPSKQVIKFEKK